MFAPLQAVAGNPCADDLGVHFERLVRAGATEDTESWSRRWSV